jgi:hypothetical protein
VELIDWDETFLHARVPPGPEGRCSQCFAMMDFRLLSQSSLKEAGRLIANTGCNAGAM